MTKIIDDTFDLPSMEEGDEQDSSVATASKRTKTMAGQQDIHDDEVNEIRQKAITAFDDIMEVGRNVNPERSARLFEVAGQFLKTGLDASNSKIEKELKAAKLKLEAKRLKIDDETLDTISHGAEVIADRNAILKSLMHESEENTVDVGENEETTDEQEQNSSN